MTFTLNACNDGVLFYHGPFSNFYPCVFTCSLTFRPEVVLTFNCSEQALMANKAALFNDNVCLDKIMATSSPIAIKRLGRQVKKFDVSVWEKYRFQIMFDVLSAKFSKNSYLSLEEKLHATGVLPIAEAAPNDAIWGIGMSVRDAYHLPAASWTGLNLLGAALVAVRNTALFTFT
jgi:ribA/ribD-fused uncharacterized protein